MSRPTKVNVRHIAGRLQVDFTIDGKRVRRFVNARTDGEAHLIGHRMLVEALDAKRAQPLSALKITATEAHRLWLEERQPGEVPRSMVGRFVKWLGPEMLIGEIDSDIMKRFQLERRKVVRPGGRPLKGTTVNADVARALGFLRWAHHAGMRGDVPKITWMKREKNPPKVLTVDEVAALLNAVKGDEFFEPFYLFALCGLRRWEIIEARWERINAAQMTLMIPRGKTADSAAAVPLFGPIVDWIHVKGKKEGFVLPMPDGMRTRSMYESMKRRFTRRTGFVLANAHRCRHTIATQLILNGAGLYAVSKLLRHATIDMTAQMYVHAGAVEMRSAIERGLPDVLKQKKGGVPVRDPAPESKSSTSGE